MSMYLYLSIFITKRHNSLVLKAKSDLLNIYKFMYFDRNISEKKDGKNKTIC